MKSRDGNIIDRKAVIYVLKEYFAQYRKYPGYTALAFLLPAVGNIFVYFVPPLVIAELINAYSGEGGLKLDATWHYVALFAGAWLLGEALWRIGMYFWIELESMVIGDLGRSTFKRITDRDYSFFANNFVGSLATKTSSYARGFETFTDTLIYSVFGNLFPLWFAIVVLWRYSPWIPLLLVACLVLVVVIIIPVVKNRSSLVALRTDAGSRLVGRLSDALTNIMAIKSYAKERPELEVYSTYVDDFVYKYKKAAHYHNQRVEMLVSPLQVGTNALGLMAAIFFASKFGLEAGAIVVVFSYYSHVTRIFFEVNRVYRNLESSISQSAEFAQLVITPPKIQDEPMAERLEVRGGRVQFSGVDFAYDPEKPALFLKDFNFEIRGGERIGLVGPSGGGKTTITKLLLRFLDPVSGSILIDGQDIRQVAQTSLRDVISYVPQEPLLFHRSLFENIAYGDEKATEEAVIKAAKLAHAHEFIEGLPEGYKTLVGERGIKLSGGQKQRVAIARAILKGSPILVLDEATSSLDSESEKFIQDGLRELMKGKTALVIAHRLSTIKHLDRIVVLSEGRIVQEGTHDELIRQKGLYANLWSHQSGEFLVDTPAELE